MTKHWLDYPTTPAKGEPMPKTKEYFYKMLAMDQELILEMKDEISKLKMTINRLRQKNETYTKNTTTQAKSEKEWR